MAKRVNVSDLVVGDVYLCVNTRKGQFDMRIVSVSGEWIEGVITDGIARSTLTGRVRECQGESVTVRDVHSTFWLKESAHA